jgi:hypothetical protein
LSVLDPHDDLAALHLAGQPDATSGLGVLRGVVQQIQEHLGQPDQIAVEVHRLRRQRDAQFEAALVDEGAARLDRPVDDLGQLDAPVAKLQRVARDAGDVDEVVDEPRQVVHVTLDEVPAPAERGLGGLRDAKQLRGVAERGERVPQLVSQRREELVLAPVGLLQLVQQPQSLVGDGHVVADRFEEGHFVRLEVIPLAAGE